MFYKIGFQKNNVVRLLSTICLSMTLIACGGEESETSQGNASNQSEQIVQQTSVNQEEQLSNTVVEQEDTAQEELVEIAPQHAEETQGTDLVSIELNWDIPVKRDNGSDLDLFEIDGYVIAYGTESGNLSNTVNVVGSGQTSAVIDELEAGTYYFAIATVDVDGVQGDYSAEIAQVIM